MQLISECLPPDSIPRFDVNLWVCHVAPTWLYSFPCMPQESQCCACRLLGILRVSQRATFVAPV